MAALAQTITVVKGKGKQTKQLVTIWKEAKIAYVDRKAELKNARGVGDASTLGRNGQALTAGYQSPSLRQRYEDDRNRDANVRASLECDYSDSYVEDNDSHLRNQYGAPWTQPRFAQSHVELGQARGRPYSTANAGRGRFEDDLTGNELAPALPTRPVGAEHELRMKVFSLNNMLAELNCIEHSAKAIIKHLETNPEAMAAVALTLAEISNLLTKMAPGVLMSFKTGAPAVLALLLSSEFLIAAGVGVGLTVVALGSYKIIKRIKEKKEKAGEKEADELEDVTADIDRITSWRRGVSEADAESIGTSVEGEFATPMASQHFRDMGLLPRTDPATQSPALRRSRSEPREVVKSSGQKPKQQSGLRNLFKKKPDAA